MSRTENIVKPLRTSSTLSLHSYPTEDTSEYIRQGLDFHKKIGFDAADFPMWLLDQTGDRWQEVTEIAAADAKERDIRFEVCHLPFTGFEFMTPEKLALFNASVHRAIDAAAILGVDYAVIHPNTYTVPLKRFNRKAEYDSVMAHLSPFKEHADKAGVNMVVENMRIVHKSVMVHRYCDSPDELCEITDALGAGVCWDFGHANIEGLKQSEAISYVGSRLKVLHINDNAGEEDIHVPPFCGNVDWKDAMQGLKSIGFKGLLNYEIITSAVPAGAREAFAQYLIATAKELQLMIDA